MCILKYLFILIDVFEKNEELRQLVESRILPRKSYLRVYLDNITNSCKLLSLITNKKIKLEIFL